MNHTLPFTPLPSTADLPAVVVDAMVTALAEQHSIGEVGRAAVSHPPQDVVNLRHAGRKPAHRASAVALYESEPLALGEEPALTSPVEDDAVGVENAGDDSARCGELPRCRCGDRLVDAVDRCDTLAGLELLERHPHDDGRTVERKVAVAPERMGGDQQERVELALLQGAPRGVGVVRA